jgi:hypothetical protein
MFESIPAPDPAYFADSPMCRGCGCRPFSDVHHIEHKGSGGRHGEAKVAINRPGNLIKLCRVCHAASHGEHLTDSGFSCDVCPRLDRCRFGRQVCGLPYQHLRPPWTHD